MYGKKLNKGADDCRKLTPDNACKIDYAEATFDAVVSILVFFVTDNPYKETL